MKKNILNPIFLLSTGFGSGLVRYAPGTFGSLAALILVVFFKQFSDFIYALITLIVIISGVFICNKALKYFKNDDPAAIVWDEFAGIFVSFLYIETTNTNLLLGFILFRFFDILKPYPIGLIDKKIKGGLGIMLDDIVAGLFTLILLQIYVIF
ncbi:MAG: phosphatidylglycerophosphatase A [Gammaproteobacteria bacterium]|nr:MAG: phosphatidylglycerophosphatase A [Gammaproteobacteria bacterium]